MRTLAVLLAMIGAFTVLMGPAIGLSFFPETKQERPAAEVSSICAGDFAQAGANGIVHPKSAALDPAVRSCASVDDWLAAARIYPAAVGGTDPRRILSARCRDRSAGLGRFATCRDLGDYRPPKSVAGTVTVVPPAASLTLGSGVGVGIILDTSGSMLEMASAGRRIDIAKESLAIIVEDALPSGMLVAIRSFVGSVDVESAGTRSRSDRRPGAKAADDPPTGTPPDDGTDSAADVRCETRLTLPLAPLDRDEALVVVDRISAKRRTGAPIAAALTAIADDLTEVTQRRTIVLVSDGDFASDNDFATCGGDPEAEIERLRTTWPDLRLHIVGVALEDDLGEPMARWAEAGGGEYFEASNTDEVVAAIETAITGRAVLGSEIRITATGGELTGSGVVGGDAIEIEPGMYEVAVLTDPPVVFSDVLVDEGGALELELPQPG